MYHKLQLHRQLHPAIDKLFLPRCDNCLFQCSTRLISAIECPIVARETISLPLPTPPPPPVSCHPGPVFPPWYLNSTNVRIWSGGLVRVPCLTLSNINCSTERKRERCCFPTSHAVPAAPAHMVVFSLPLLVQYLTMPSCIQHPIIVAGPPPRPLTIVVTARCALSAKLLNAAGALQDL